MPIKQGSRNVPFQHPPSSSDAGPQPPAVGWKLRQTCAMRRSDSTAAELPCDDDEHIVHGDDFTGHLILCPELTEAYL